MGVATRGVTVSVCGFGLDVEVLCVIGGFVSVPCNNVPSDGISPGIPYVRSDVPSDRPDDC